MAESEDTKLSSLNLKNLFSRGRWHHVILLTYSFDLPFFESYILPILVQNGSRSITIAADAEWLEQRLPLWRERGQIREAGRRYILCGIKVPGAFHPKILLATNKTGGTALIGSGNISPYSMANGGELFTAVEWQDQQIPSLAQEIWALCNAVASTLSIDGYFAKRVGEMGNAVHHLALPSNSNQLRHNLYEPLFNQLIREVASQQVANLLLWSPFTDAKLDALKRLVSELQPKQVTLALQPSITCIDGTRLQTIVDSQSHIEWHFVELLENASIAKHMIHAKGILITLTSGEDILLAGSPNLSRPALLQTAHNGNMEAALLLRGQNMRNQLFEGIISLRELQVDFQALRWTSDISSEPQESKSVEIRLLGASLEGDLLTLNTQGSFPPTSFVSLDNSLPLLTLLYRNEKLLVQIPPNIAPQIAKIVWDNGTSNSVIITHVKQLMEHAQESIPSRSISLAALIDGDDSQWIAFLNELAEFVIIDPYDIVRANRDLPRPSTEETDEAENPLSPEDFSNIDFKAMMQRHNLHSGVSSIGGSSYYTPSSYWLDEVASYFKVLSHQQQKGATLPEPTSDSEDSDGDSMERPSHAIQPMPISKKVRTLIRNRIRRFINGLRTPAFYQKVPQEWIITNYIRFLNLFEALWKRLQNPHLAIFQSEEHNNLCLELLSSFWGSDLENGYWTSLNEHQMIEAGLNLIECHSDALTLASANRILVSRGDASRVAPFVIAGIVHAVEPLDLFTMEAAENALKYLEPIEYNPTLLLQQIKNTQYYFTWDRYLLSLSQKYQLPRATLEDTGFKNYKTLVIDTSKDIFTALNVLAVFTDWIQACAKHDPNRQVFQMYWGDSKDLLVYSLNSTELMLRRPGAISFSPLCVGVPPSEFATWSSLPIST